MSVTAVVSPTRSPSQLHDVEGLSDHDFMWNIGLLHTLDDRPRRTLLELALELEQGWLRPLGHDFHRAIAQVAGVAGELQSLSLAPHEPPEAHALHAAVHH